MLPLIIVTNENINKITYKYVSWQNFFFYRSVKMWNELPNELVSCKYLEYFRLKLEKFNLNEILTSKIQK